MANNGRVFVSHSHEDNERCAPLLAALDAWNIDYFFDTQGLGAGQQLNATIQKEIQEREVLLRVCTANTQRSFWMSLEVSAFRGLQADAQRRGKASDRILINLILSGDYTREPFDVATLFIDAASRPRQVWMADLARALGVTGSLVTASRAPTRRMSRREAIGLGGGAVVALGSVALAGDIYATYHPGMAPFALEAEPGKLLWSFPHESQKKDLPPIPTVSDNTLYLMNGFQLAAFDLGKVATNHTGAKRWSKSFTPQFAFTGSYADNGAVYVAVDYTLYAFSATDGAKRWTASLSATEKGDFAAFNVSQDHSVVLAMTDHGTLHTYRASTGEELWKQRVEPVRFGLATISNPTTDDQHLYVGSTDHAFYAYKLGDGSQVWKYLTRGKIISSPMLANGTVYFGSNDGYVYALNAHDGTVRWKYLTGGPVNSSPNVVDGVVYIASDDHYLYTVDADTGKPYWRAPVGDDDGSGFLTNTGSVTCRPAVTGDAVCVINELYWVVRSYNRSDGAPRWKYESKDNLQNADPVAAGGAVYFGSGDQTLYVYGA